jgi:tetratricopeptide (TPR) repeat protein
VQAHRLSREVCGQVFKRLIEVRIICRQACKARLLAALISAAWLGAAPVLAQSSAADAEGEITALLKQVTALREAKKDAEAIQLAQKALSIAERTFPAGSDKLVRPLGVLGWAYYGQSRYAEAEPLFLKALDIREKTDWQARPNGIGFCLLLGSLYYNQGKLDKTAAIYKRCSDFAEPKIAAKTLRPDDPDVHQLNSLLQEVYVALARPADAEQLIKRRISQTEQALGYGHAYVGDLLNTLAALYGTLGRTAEATPLFERSLAIAEKVLADPAADLGPSLTRETIAGKLNAVAQHYEKAGRRDRAQAVFELARRAQAPAPAVETKPDDDPEALARQARIRS